MLDAIGMVFLAGYAARFRSVSAALESLRERAIIACRERKKRLRFARKIVTVKRQGCTRSDGYTGITSVFLSRCSSSEDTWTDIVSFLSYFSYVTRIDSLLRRHFIGARTQSIYLSYLISVKPFDNRQVGIHAEWLLSLRGKTSSSSCSAKSISSSRAITVINSE